MRHTLVFFLHFRTDCISLIFYFPFCSHYVNSVLNRPCVIISLSRMYIISQGLVLKFDKVAFCVLDDVDEKEKSTACKMSRVHESEGEECQKSVSKSKYLCIVCRAFVAHLFIVSISLSTDVLQHFRADFLCVIRCLFVF
jgi:hypothetical protein